MNPRGHPLPTPFPFTSRSSPRCFLGRVAPFFFCITGFKDAQVARTRLQRRMEMKNDAAPWDRLIWTDHELDWLEEVFAGGFLLPGDLLWILKIDTTGTDSWNIKCLAWIIGRLFFVFLLPISRVEASRFQKMEITVKSWNVESRRMLVVSKRRRRRKFIPSNPITVSGPRWFQRFLSLEFRTKPSNVRI